LAYQREAFDVYLAVNNMLSNEYFSYVAKSAFSNAKDYYPAPEQNFIFGINLKF
jgi:hypothetical protein